MLGLCVFSVLLRLIRLGELVAKVAALSLILPREGSTSVRDVCIDRLGGLWGGERSRKGRGGERGGERGR